MLLWESSGKIECSWIFGWLWIRLARKLFLGSHSFSIRRKFLLQYEPSPYSPMISKIADRIACLSVLREAAKGWSKDGASRLAAAISFYAALSLAPLVALIVMVCGIFIGDEAARDMLVKEVASITDRQSAMFIRSLLDESGSDPGNWWKAGIGVLVLIWGSTRLFYELQRSLDIVWNVEAQKEKPLIQVAKRRIVSFGMTLSAAFLLLVSLAVNTTVAYIVESVRRDLPGQDWLWFAMSSAVSFVVVWALFTLLYKGLPSCSVPWKCAIWGALASSALFSVGKDLFGWYLSRQDSLEGAAGALLVVLLWVFFSAQIFFFGAEVGKSLQDRR